MTILSDKISTLQAAIEAAGASSPAVGDLVGTLAKHQLANGISGGGGGGSSNLGIIHTETLLTVPGVTASRSFDTYTNALFTYLVSSINTSVVVRIEGSNNGTDWINLDPSGDKVVIANGLDFYQLVGITPAFMRFNFVSESGGSSATIAVVARFAP